MTNAKATPFMLSIRCLLIGLLALPSLVHAEEGWSIGLVSIIRDNYEDDAESRLFFPPVIHQDNTDFMFIPTLQYSWQQWSAGLDGIGWQSLAAEEGKPEVEAKVGFPVSYAAISGGTGPRQYRGEIGTAYNDGFAGSFKLTASLFQYDQVHGIDERAGQFGQSIGVSAPLYINKEKARYVFAKARLVSNNAELEAHQLKQSAQLSQSDYQHLEYSATAVVKPTDRFSIVQSLALSQWDSQLVDEISELNRLSWSYLLVLSYKL